jgi:hypothetical protein
VADHLDRIASWAVDARADRADLPLAGVPVAVKDTVPVAGEPMRLGSAAMPDTSQTEDHPVVARLHAVGAVIVGLTSLPELAIYPPPGAAEQGGQAAHRRRRHLPRPRRHHPARRRRPGRAE